MHLYGNALYRTQAGNLYRYCGAVMVSVYHKKIPMLRFALVKRHSSKVAAPFVDLPTSALHNPGTWLRNLTLVGRNYVSKK